MAIRLIKLFISLGYCATDFFMKSIQSMFCMKVPCRCVVLYYHAVTSDQRIKFAQQMGDLVKRCKPITLEGPKSLENGIDYAAVTFDDGYACIIENAIPELVRRNIPATLFIPTGCLGQYSPWIRGREYLNREVVMTERQIKDISNDLISIGSHCVSHTNLLVLSSEKAREEIFASKQDLERMLGREVRFLSFPHGDFKSEHVMWAREAGYQRVFSIEPMVASSQPEGYVMGRVKVDPTDWPTEFRLKISGAYRWLPWAMVLKHKLYAAFGFCKARNILPTRREFTSNSLN